eukprot:5047378-Lingulodinium_polyedra.AAC.1
MYYTTLEGFRRLFYCGRQLGVLAIPGSESQCGPADGPQCASRARVSRRLILFVRWQTLRATLIPSTGQRGLMLVPWQCPVV